MKAHPLLLKPLHFPLKTVIEHANACFYQESTALLEDGIQMVFAGQLDQLDHPTKENGHTHSNLARGTGA